MRVTPSPEPGSESDPPAAVTADQVRDHGVRGDRDHAVHHRPAAVIEQGRAAIAAAPTDLGTLRVVVRRPAEGEREVLAEGRLSTEDGLVGDSWHHRGSSRTADGSAHPDMQLNVMGTRVLDAIADEDRWPLAGDQLLVDLDLSPSNLPAGTRLAIGEAVIEVTDQPHRGCDKFAARFGLDALRFVNTGEGRRQRYRGINAKVVVPGPIRPGDEIAKI